MSTHSFTVAVARLFRANPNTWISSETLMATGGRMAWRTRCSEARRHFGMNIINRTRKVGRVTVSEYKFVPAATPAQQELTGL